MPPSARSRQAPCSTSAPRPLARSANSAISRDFPIPASPATIDDLRRSVGGAGQRGIERIEFERSPDEVRRRDGARHAAESTPRSYRRRAGFEVPGRSGISRCPMAARRARPSLVLARRTTCRTTGGGNPDASPVPVLRRHGQAGPRVLTGGRGRAVLDDEPLTPIQPGAFSRWMANRERDAVDARDARSIEHDGDAPIAAVSAAGAAGRPIGTDGRRIPPARAAIAARSSRSRQAPAAARRGAPPRRG